MHRVHEVLRLAEVLGVPGVPELVAPRGASKPGAAPDRPYAVIHAVPMFRYKRWTTDGWRQLAAELAARGLAVAATGGPSETSGAISTRSGRGGPRCGGSTARSRGLSWPG